MVWSVEQRIRLAIEKEQLDSHFRLGIDWIDPQDKTKVEVLLKSNSNRDYLLRVYIPKDFPNSCPILVVTCPKRLLLQNGSRLPQQSYTFHTLEDIDGYHRICHFYPPHWTQDITLYQVFMKGRLWIEGYEAHLRTGKEMNEFLGEQQGAPGPQSARQQINNSLTPMARPLAINSPISGHEPPLVSNPIVRSTSHQRISSVRGRNASHEPVSQRRRRQATQSTSTLNSRRRNNLTRSDVDISFPQANDPVDFITPQYSTERQIRNANSYTQPNRRRNNPDLPRPLSLGTRLTPSFTARYDDEITNTPGTEDVDVETNDYENDQPIVEPSTIHPVRNSKPTLPRRFPIQNSNPRVPRSRNVLAPAHKQSDVSHISNGREYEEELTSDENSNHGPHSRCRPPGGVDILAPFPQRTAPKLRRALPK